MRSVKLDSPGPAKANDDRRESQRTLVCRVFGVGQEHKLFNLIENDVPNVHGHPRDDDIDELSDVFVEVRNMGVRGDVGIVKGQPSLGERPRIDQ